MISLVIDFDFRTFIFAECDNRPSNRIKALQKAITKAGAFAPATIDIDKEIAKTQVCYDTIVKVIDEKRGVKRQRSESVRLPLLKSKFTTMIPKRRRK